MDQEYVETEIIPLTLDGHSVNGDEHNVYFTPQKQIFSKMAKQRLMTASSNRTSDLRKSKSPDYHQIRPSK